MKLKMRELIVYFYYLHPTVAVVQRIHFLDNLRATLTILLIFHHAVIYATRPSLGLLRLLDVAGLKDIVGDYRSSTANGDLQDQEHMYLPFLSSTTPIYLPVGWKTLAHLRFHASRNQNQGFAKMVFRHPCLFVVLVTLITFGNCFGLRLIPFIVKRHFPLDFPGFGAPITYVIAYIAGVNFTLVQQYILIASPAKAIGALVGSALVPYIALGIAQDRFEPLWKFIEPTTDSEGARWFPDPGFNPPTIFFTLWNPTVIYIFSIALISVFASLRFTTKNWGVWTRHTYLQTYIHMIPIAMTAYFVRNHPSIEHPIVKSVICGIAGVLGSWGVSFIWLTQLSIFKLVYARILRH
ncbi:hypothetical protein BDZ97DRAFT_1847707 [Flammula alnicola]|nr:hypothetical protein BDZ97DRAFT_1847707 [Flammula alnicola]